MPKARSQTTNPSYGQFLSDEDELQAKLDLIDQTVDRIDPNLASQPTQYVPGTVEKVVVLRQRLEQGLPLFLPEDGHAARRDQRVVAEPPPAEDGFPED